MTENGVLSFANPNYHLDPSDVNRNPEASSDSELPDEEDYDELYEELDAAYQFSCKPAIQSRRNYAKLDTLSMGIDLGENTSPILENEPLLAPDSENNLHKETPEDPSTSTTVATVENSEANNNSSFDSNDNKETENTMGRRSGFLDYYISLENATRQRKETVPLLQNSGIDQTCTSNKQRSTVSSPERESTSGSSDKEDSDDIPHVHGNITNDLYAVPVRKNSQKCQDQKRDEQRPNMSICNIPTSDSRSPSERHLTIQEQILMDEMLPPGWERHEDDSGAYYWHISSGTIQREPPPALSPTPKSHSKHLSRDLDIISSISDFSLPSSKLSTSSSSSASASSEVNFHNSSTCSSSTSETQLKRRSYTEGTCSLTPDKKPIRFAVRSLGWVEIAEDDLTPERSSKAVNKCIVDLSLGRNDILDVVGRWGDGKDLYMDLDDYCLRLTDPQDLTILNTQPIHTIRVWGVGRDNGRERDFAYVARDRVSRKHMCHVFRCDIPARIIANTLRDICKKIMIERSLHHNLAKPVGPGSRGAARPTNLPTEQRRLFHCSSSYPAQSFPTPMEEPKKIIKVHYLGTTLASRAVGMEVLNSAIDNLSAQVPASQYKYVNVAVAPSTITITEPGENGKQLAECRVRYLSFLGIGHNVKHCAFIMHTAQDQFVAYIFHCEPSSGALCKTIEAACKLRYQKCLDAHRLILEKKNAEAQAQENNKGIATTIRCMLGNLTTRLSRSAES